MGSRFRTLDPWLFLAPLALIGIGSVVIYVLTVDGGLGLTIRQGIYAALAVLILAALPFFDYRSLRGLSPWLYGLGMVTLGLVPLIGKEEFGAKLWIEIGPAQFQPGEVMKLLVLLLLAATLAGNHSRDQKLTHSRFWVSLLIFLVPVAIIFLQPDFGTASIIAFSGLSMLLCAPLRRNHKLLIGLGVLVLVVGVVLAFREVAPFSNVLKPYQRNRLVSFIDPQHDTTGSGYNVAQAVIAVGSGGFSGSGLGFGTQSQLRFVPVAHADFIFAAIAEAWGWIGSFTVITLLTLVVLRSLHAAQIAKDSFGAYLCIGVGAKVLFETLVNVGMNMGLMPVTGIPLPFLSYGGTALITSALCLALAQSVVLRYKRLTF
jgi:rod shape determining protein RodA